MPERLVFTEYDYSSLVAEYNALNLGLSKEVSERLLNYAKGEILKSPDADNLIFGDHYLFNQEATRIVLINLSKTTSVQLRKITNWGGPDKYLADLLLYLKNETRKNGAGAS